MKNKIQPKDYYDFFPPNAHRTGDIWRDLPNFFIFNIPHSYGIVVTPACDLAQKKSETITYLPIASIEDYLNTPAFYNEIWLNIQSQLEKLKLLKLITPPERYELPILEEILEVSKKIEEMCKTDKSKDGALTRIKAYEIYAHENKNKRKITIKKISDIFTSGDFDKIIKKIVTNSFKVDIHFLPADEKNIESSSVPNHSLILFRYALTIPVEILNIAQISNSFEWDSQILKMKDETPIINNFGKVPIRLSTLKDDFLSDLLSRYVSMQIRLGARDFTKETINQYAEQLRS